MRLLELQALERMCAGRQGSAREPDDFQGMLDSLISGDVGQGDDGEVGLRQPKGTMSMQKVLKLIERFPGAWTKEFDDQLKKKLWSDTTGQPYSLLDYVFKRMRFGNDQGDLERVAHMLCMMYGIYKRGPDHHDALGAFIIQCFKATEQATKDKDWTLAWQWTGLEDPRPRRFTRGLAHPAEFAASVAYLREMQTLQTHLDAARKGRGRGKGKDGEGGQDDSAADGGAPGGGKGRRRKQQQQQPE